MVGTIDVVGKLNSDFSNALETDSALDNFRTYHALAYPGGDAGIGHNSYRPCILDQKYLDLGADPTGVLDSTAAFQAFVDDLNLYRVVGVVTQGVWLIDPATSFLLMNGAGIEAVECAFSLNYDDDFTDLDPRAGTGVVFKKPYSANRNVPIFAMHRGSCILNFPIIWYCDQVARYNSGAITITYGSYPTLGGTGPDVYAPAIVTDHTHDDDGHALVGGRNAGGKVEVMGLGYTTLVYFGDPDPDEEDWAEDFSTGTGKGIAVFDVYVKGFGLGDACVIENCGNFGNFRADLTPGYWTEASQVENYPFIREAQRNARALRIKRKLVGCTAVIRGRQMLEAVLCENSTAFDPDAAGPDGQDRGKVANNDFDIHVESTPTALRAQDKTFLYGNTIRVAGHLHEHDWTACTDPILLIQTDKAKAGTIDRTTGDFKAFSIFANSARNNVIVDVQESSGPLFRNTSADAGKWIFSGPNITAFCEGSKLTTSMIENLSTDTVIIDNIDLIQIRSDTSSRLYDVADAAVGLGQKLFVGPKLVCGSTAATAVVGQASWDGYSLGVGFDPDTVTAINDDDEPE